VDDELECRFTLFQFHFGSIQTRRGHLYPPDAVPVSIPLWFDSNYELARVRGAIASFQFHFGSIQTRRLELQAFSHSNVSIPLWFDSNAPALPAQ